ncbi:MFS transporter [Candidatus Roizmanbacteria bacterium]|nr:MFS transporter [Candidatus Roizmanbacteria bacterium]
MLFNTLAASFIWGVNTLFLLDAGLNNLQAFAANAFFTGGQVIFEVPTGIVADTWGRRASYLLGTLTLGVSTLLYLWAWQAHAPFWAWAATSILLGLGFTFFSGATEAWLVDALNFTKFKGTLESVFAKGQIVGGVAMLTGSVAGGFVAQSTNLGVPYILRAGVLGITFLIAFLFMKDLGFTPRKSEQVFKDMKKIFTTSIDLGLKNPPVRWVMLAAPFGTGVLFYAFYAMQPHLLNLWGNKEAYGIAGLAAAIVACAQIVGGLTATRINRIFRRRTSVILTAVIVNVILLALIGVTTNFWIAVALLVGWGLIFAASMPVRQTYLNGLIPSEQRATVLSFDSLVGSSGGVVAQPILGKVADVWNYP